MASNPPFVYGIDFSSAPKRDKPIVLACCEYRASEIVLTHFEEFRDWPAFEHWLQRPGSWIAGFDFPFGLPRRYVERSEYGNTWSEMVATYPRQGKEEFANRAMAAFLAAQSPEDKHRLTDFASGSHSPLKTRTNPPVGLMFYEGAWRLKNSDVSIPGLRKTDSSKIALEAYPGLLARRMGARLYKNDKSTSSENRIAARKMLLEGLQHPNAVASKWVCKPVRFKAQAVEQMLHPSGDWLDATLCAVQAAWGYERSATGYGLPAKIDPVEGWIVSAQ